MANLFLLKSQVILWKTRIVWCSASSTECSDHTDRKKIINKKLLKIEINIHFRRKFMFCFYQVPSNPFLNKCTNEGLLLAKMTLNLL